LLRGFSGSIHRHIAALLKTLPEPQHDAVKAALRGIQADIEALRPRRPQDVGTSALAPAENG
jgi:hypothetical protein